MDFKSYTDCDNFRGKEELASNSRYSLAIEDMLKNRAYISIIYSSCLAFLILLPLPNC